MAIDLDQSKKFSKEAQEEELKKLKARDGDGRFVPKDTPPESAVTTSKKVSGAGAVIKELSEDPSLDKPVLSITVNNPLSKLLAWIKEIKKKQTTTFEFKVKVPLIALPVFLIVVGSAFAFMLNLGKDTDKETVHAITPTITPRVMLSPVVTTKTGTIRTASSVIVTITKSVEASTEATTSIVPTLGNYRYVLVDRNNDVIILIPHSTIRLDRFINREVVVTGLYDSEKQTMNLSKNSDVEALL